MILFHEGIILYLLMSLCGSFLIWQFLARTQYESAESTVVTLFLSPAFYPKSGKPLYTIRYHSTLYWVSEARFW